MRRAQAIVSADAVASQQYHTTTRLPSNWPMGEMSVEAEQRVGITRRAPCLKVCKRARVSQQGAAGPMVGAPEGCVL